MHKVTAESITLHDKNGNWLGQIVLTSDGALMSVTDYGNLSYAWRTNGDDFKKFLMGLNVSYFGQKMYSGLTYIVYNKKVEQACYRYAEKILPALQEHLRKELEQQEEQQ